MPESVNGVFTEAKECVPIEWLRRFDPPRWMMLDGLEQSVDELKDEIRRLKGLRSFMIWVAVALLFVCSCSILRAPGVHGPCRSVCRS